jgi:hypothetical protein
MKKLLVALLLLLVSPAHGGVPCTLPFNFQNGQLADATQVMANYNAIVACLQNAAAAGANSDITALSALSTPIPPALGGTTAFVGTADATLAGGNAFTVAATIPASFSLTNGFRVIWRPGQSSTNGPMTLNVSGAGAQPLKIRTAADGTQDLLGAEIVQFQIQEVVWNGGGGYFQLLTNSIPFPVGTVLDTIAAGPDVGFLLLNGSCISNTVFNVLWAKMGSPGTGGCAAGQFPLPDARGRVIAMIDSGGSNRITIAGGNIDGTQLYNAGGNQNWTLTTTQIPNLSGTTGAGTAHQHNVFLFDPGHGHTIGIGPLSAGVVSLGGVASKTVNLGAGPNAVNSNTTGTTIGSVNGVANDNLTANESAHTHSFTANSGGGNAHPILQPTLMLNKQVKY